MIVPICGYIHPHTDAGWGELKINLADNDRETAYSHWLFLDKQCGYRQDIASKDASRIFASYCKVFSKPCNDISSKVSSRIFASYCKVFSKPCNDIDSKVATRNLAFWKFLRLLPARRFEPEFRS